MYVRYEEIQGSEKPRLHCRGFLVKTSLQAGGLWLSALPLSAAVWAAHTVVHLLHLLNLRRGEHACKLLLGALTQGLHLFACSFLRELSIAVDSFHLLVAVGEDRLELGSLIWRKVQLSRQVFDLTMRIRSVMTEVVRLLSVGWCCRLLSERGATGKGKRQGSGEKNAVHRKCSLVADWGDSTTCY
jgi:hypothetical protein